MLSGYNTADWTFVTENVPKFIIGLESMVICVIFMMQHYALYRGNESSARQSPKASKTSDGLQTKQEGTATNVVHCTMDTVEVEV